MNIDEILLVGKWGLKQRSPHKYTGKIKDKNIEVLAQYKIGRVFVSEFIPNGYLLYIDGVQYKPEKKRITLREIENKFREL